MTIMSYTFVTALYNIQRETRGDGRKWEDYLEWFKTTLQIKAPLVVYISQDLVDFVKEHRSPEYASLTKIIVQPLPQLPYAFLHDQIENVIQSPAYRAKILDPTRIECNLPYYTIIQYSKFEWLRHVADINPFDTTLFFWIDAGVSRFVDIEGAKMNPVTLPQGKLGIQCSPYIGSFPMKDYLWSNQCLMCGTMFGGDKLACDTVGKEVYDFLTQNINKMYWINNEQILLAYFAIVERKPLFHLIPNTTNEHLPVFRMLFG